MKNLAKLYVISLVFFITFSTKSIAADNILPVPKPAVDEETKSVVAKKKIYNLKKNQQLKLKKLKVNRL